MLIIVPRGGVIEPGKSGAILTPTSGSVINCPGACADVREYLHYGGYPQSVAAADAGQEVPGELLDTLLDVVFRDTFGGSGLSELDTHALLARIGKEIANPANVSAIAADCDLAAETVKRRNHWVVLDERYQQGAAGGLTPHEPELV